MNWMFVTWVSAESSSSGVALWNAAADWKLNKNTIIHCPQSTLGNVRAVPWIDITSTVGDTISTLEDIQYSLGGGGDTTSTLCIISKILAVSLQRTAHSPQYWWYPSWYWTSSTVMMVSLNRKCTIYSIYREHRLVWITYMNRIKCLMCDSHFLRIHWRGSCLWGKPHYWGWGAMVWASSVSTSWMPGKRIMHTHFL